MSNLNTFVDKVKSVIDSNAELKNSVVLNKVLESVRYTGDDVQFLTDLKESLSDVNKFLSSKELCDVISSIDMKLTESNNTDSAIRNRMSNELDLAKMLESVIYSAEHRNTQLTAVSHRLLEQVNSTKYGYLMINPIVEALSGFSEYKCVKKVVDACTEYLKENAAKLVVLDAVNYLAEGRTNDYAMGILTESLHESNFNPDSLKMKLGSHANVGICGNVLESLRQIRQESTKGFDLGSGSSKVSVYEYIGPVLVEGADVTFNVNGKYIHITPNQIPEDAISRKINLDAPIKVAELKESYVSSEFSKYYNTQKAFESLGFRLAENASFAKLNRSSVEFRLNESSNVDIIYNGNVSNLESIKRDGTQMFESSAVKSTLYGLLENIDMIGHMQFVKFIVNENAASMIVNLADDYYVYDFTNESKVDTYKMDAYKLYEFCLNKFNYDMSSTFGFAINDARSKYNKAEECKKNTLNALNDLNESVAKIDSTLNGELEPQDRELLEGLKKSFLAEIESMNESYQKLCKEQDQLISVGSCLIQEGLTEDEDSGDAVEGDSQLDGSAEPEENTTEDMDTAQEEGGDTPETGDDGDAQSVDESKVNECGDADDVKKKLNCEGVKTVSVTYEDGTVSEESVDSELPKEEIAKTFAAGNIINGKKIASYEVAECEDCKDDSEVVSEVNESISVPEWAVSALVDNDFRGLTADKFNEALAFKAFLMESGVKSIELDESRECEILESNSMNESRQECVYLNCTIVNEGLFKKDIYGVEAPFAGITNWGLFKDGRMKKECNKFLEECAPIIVKKCTLAIIQNLLKLKADGEDKLDEIGKAILEVNKKYDENSVAEEIKTCEDTLKSKETQLISLKDKFVAKRKELAPAFNYDIALTKTKMLEIKSKILQDFREGKKVENVEGIEGMDKFKACQQVVDMIGKAISESENQAKQLRGEADKLKEEADKVSKSGSDEGSAQQNSQKIKAFDIDGKEAEIELTSGIKFKNVKEGDEHNGTEFELGEKSEDGTKFKIIVDGAQNGNTISVETLNTEVPAGNYKVVSMPKKEEPVQDADNSEAPAQNA